MADLEPAPSQIPKPDRFQIERLNVLYDLNRIASTRSLRERLITPWRRLFGRMFSRQTEFNAAVVDHINRNAAADEELYRFVQSMFDAFDDVRRYQQANAARERRSVREVEALSSAQAELRISLGMLQQASQNLKREVTRLAESGVAVNAVAVPEQPAPGPAAPASQMDALDSHKYVGFEDQFRGSSEDIRQRVLEYLPVFERTQDVLDVGCGRGEFLTVLKEHGIRARGIDVNSAMVDICRERGLDVTEADALAHLRSLPDASLGGLFAAQVIEHLEPRYLVRFLDAAVEKLRPGAPIVLETINPACWFAFFESYIRDITHVRPIHPETLKYLLVASGFQQVDIRYRAPFPEHAKLQPIPANPSLGNAVNTLNANVQRINELLFSWLDYAAIGQRP